jgi:hypothetical protein
MSRSSTVPELVSTVMSRASMRIGGSVARAASATGGSDRRGAADFAFRLRSDSS